MSSKVNGNVVNRGSHGKEHVIISIPTGDSFVFAEFILFALPCITFVGNVANF